MSRVGAVWRVIVLLGPGCSDAPPEGGWLPTATMDAPAPRSGHGAVWTGAEMIVWVFVSGGQLRRRRRLGGR
jgi:hypothetical protein